MCDQKVSHNICIALAVTLCVLIDHDQFSWRGDGQCSSSIQVAVSEMSS